MATSNTPTLSTAPDVPQIGLFSMFRLGVFNMGLGIMSLLTLGVLNQVMITELGVPAVVAAGAIAVHQFMAPARVWFGQMSDAKPLLGYHRSGYIWLGITGMWACAFIGVQVIWQVGAIIEQNGGWGVEAYPWVGLLAAVFACYGLCLSATSTPFTALLVDVSDDKTQSRLVGIGWAMLMVGILFGALVLLPGALDSIAGMTSVAEIRGPINRLFVVAPALVCAIAVFSTYGIEKRYSLLKKRSDASGREDNLTLREAIKILGASRQTSLFFCFLLVLSLSLFTQDAVLEPYGRQIFGLSISGSAALNGPFACGTLLGIVGTAFVLVPLLGKKRTIKVGCLSASGCLVLLAAVGITANPVVLFSAVGLFGLAAGLLTTGSILLMIDLTAAETAGTFIGAWGLAQAMARGSATLLGGGLLSIGKNITGAAAMEVPTTESLLPAYALVFIFQAVGMLVAIAVVSKVNIQEFKLDAKRAITAALESDMD